MSGRKAGTGRGTGSPMEEAWWLVLDAGDRIVEDFQRDTEAVGAGRTRFGAPSLVDGLPERYGVLYDRRFAAWLLAATETVVRKLRRAQAHGALLDTSVQFASTPEKLAMRAILNRAHQLAELQLEQVRGSARQAELEKEIEILRRIGAADSDVEGEVLYRPRVRLALTLGILSFVPTLAPLSALASIFGGLPPFGTIVIYLLGTATHLVFSITILVLAQRARRSGAGSEGMGAARALAIIRLSITIGGNLWALFLAGACHSGSCP